MENFNTELKKIFKSLTVKVLMEHFCNNTNVWSRTADVSSEVISRVTFLCLIVDRCLCFSGSILGFNPFVSLMDQD